MQSNIHLRNLNLDRDLFFVSTRARGGLHVSQIQIADFSSFSNVPVMCFIQIGENDIGRFDCSLSKNHKSTDQFPRVIHEFISEGKLQNRIAGPFSAPPFEHFVVSPLGVVQNSEAGKYRVIHDHSFPKQHSVNDLIPPENSIVQYESIDNTTTLLNHFGRESLMAKTDFKDAFRIIPIHPDDYKILGFLWHGSYDRCFPMGASSSCKIFESLSQSLRWVMYSKFNVGGMFHMLDDFFFIGPKNSYKSLQDINHIISIYEECGIPIKMGKTHFPTSV